MSAKTNKQKTLAKLAKQKTFSRADLLIIFNALELRVGVESFSRVLDLKQEIGFDHD